MDDADRFVVIAVAPGAEHHRPETERAHLHARGSQGSVLHEYDTIQPRCVSAS
jgi:hypothetical protein